MAHASSSAYVNAGAKPVPGFVAVGAGFEEEDQTYVPQTMPAAEPYEDFAAARGPTLSSPSYPTTTTATNTPMNSKTRTSPHQKQQQQLVQQQQQVQYQQQQQQPSSSIGRSRNGTEKRQGSSGYVPVWVWQRHTEEPPQYMNERCAQGHHEIHRRFGLCGICSAVLLFPLGLVCLFMDSMKRCKHCGVVLDDSNPGRPARYAATKGR